MTPLPHQRHSQKHRLIGKFCEPCFFGKLGIPKAELREAPGVLVDKRCHTELLRKSPQLTDRRCAFVQVYKVRADSPFREKTQRLSRIRAFLYPENLNFQALPQSRLMMDDNK